MSRPRLLISLGAMAVAASVLVVLVVGLASQPPFPEGSAAPPSMARSPSIAAAVLHVDGLATVDAPAGLRIWADPEYSEAPPLRGDLPSGTTVYLTRGPEVVDGETWWEIQPASGSDIPPPFGWIRASDEAGDPNLLPLTPVCPVVDQVMTAAALRAMGGILALACYGDEAVTVEGTMTCTRSTRDGGVAGPSWLAPYSLCIMDDALAVNGPLVEAILEGGLQPPNPRTGRFRVQGHFDDAEARTCSLVPVGVSVTSPVGPPDPEAVIICRQLFVATNVEPLPDS